MRIKKGASKLIHYFHLDVKYCLLTGKMVKTLYEFFRLLDIHNCNALNGKQTGSICVFVILIECLNGRSGRFCVS